MNEQLKIFGKSGHQFYWVSKVTQGAKLLGSLIPGETKIDGGNPNFRQGFPTGNPEIVRVIKSILI